MPSGAKKRKAAKKKKRDQQPNNNSSQSSGSTHSRGDENVDIKEGDEQQIESGKNLVRVERDIEIEKKSNKRDGSSSGSSGSSSSSNSDDESLATKNTQALEEIAMVLDSLKEANPQSETVAEAIQHEPIKETSFSVVENIPSSNSDKITFGSVDSVESAIDENGDKKTSFVEDKVGLSVASVDVANVQSVDENVVISEPNEPLVQEIDDKLTVNAPTTTTGDNGAECEEVSGVTEPLLAPRPAQKTPWRICCGIFDVFSGSNT